MAARVPWRGSRGPNDTSFIRDRNGISVLLSDAEAVQRTAEGGGLLRRGRRFGNTAADTGTVHRLQPDGESHAADRGARVRGAGGHWLGRADRRRGKIHAKEARAAEVDYSGPTDWMQLSNEEMVGIAYFRKKNRVSCHAMGDSGCGSGTGPDQGLDRQRRGRG